MDGTNFLESSTEVGTDILFHSSKAENIHDVILNFYISSNIRFNVSDLHLYNDFFGI